MSIQLHLHDHPTNEKLATKEQQMLKHLHLLKKENNATMRLKATINSVNLGDDNTRFFHQSIKQRQRFNRITNLHINDEDIAHPTRIQDEFYNFYNNLFSTGLRDRAKINLEIARNGAILFDHQRGLLNLSFNKEEIKNAMWSIPDDKTPGLDGFNNKFYESTWEIVEEDVV